MLFLDEIHTRFFWFFMRWMKIFFLRKKFYSDLKKLRKVNLGAGLHDFRKI